MAKNLLIVDDSATMRQLVSCGSRRAGIEVDACREANDGVEGPKTVEAASFDLILADVDMPIQEMLGPLLK